LFGFKRKQVFEIPESERANVNLKELFKDDWCKPTKKNRGN
jgi:hypothetical protein